MPRRHDWNDRQVQLNRILEKLEPGQQVDSRTVQKIWMQRSVHIPDIRCVCSHMKRHPRFKPIPDTRPVMFEVV